MTASARSVDDAAAPAPPIFRARAAGREGLKAEGALLPARGGGPTKPEKGSSNQPQLTPSTVPAPASVPAFVVECDTAEDAALIIDLAKRLRARVTPATEEVTLVFQEDRRWYRR